MPRLAFAWLAAAGFAASLGYFLFSYLFGFDGTHGEPYAAAIDVALFTVFALHHSLFARTGVKALVTRLVSPPLERAVYTMIASLLFTLVCWEWRTVEGTAWTLGGPWRLAGYSSQAAGIILTVIGARALDVWELAGVRQVLPGGSTPPRLKTDGVYGFVRHPLYFAWALLVFGAPDMTMTRLTFAVVSTGYLMAAIPLEERGLIETFGRDYASYREKVRWRMLPFLY